MVLNYNYIMNLNLKKNWIKLIKKEVNYVKKTFFIDNIEESLLELKKTPGRKNYFI